MDMIIAILKQLGELLLASLFSFVAAGVRTIAENGGDLLIEAVDNAVAASEASGGSSDEKYQAAFDAAKSTMEEKGVAVANNALNFAIEAAVAKLKEGAAELNKPLPE